MVRFHDGDHVVDRAPLERMHRGRPGMIDVAQLGFFPVQLRRPPVLESERDVILSDRRHLGRAAVHEAELGRASR